MRLICLIDDQVSGRVRLVDGSPATDVDRRVVVGGAGEPASDAPEVVPGGTVALVAVPAAVAGAVERVMAVPGGLDILVSNAGVAPYGPFGQVTVEEIDHALTALGRYARAEESASPARLGFLTLILVGVAGLRFLESG